MEDVGTFNVNFVHFTVFCYILWTFGIVCGNMVYFSSFGILYQEKSGNPGPKRQKYRRGVVLKWLVQTRRQVLNIISPLWPLGVNIDPQAIVHPSGKLISQRNDTAVGQKRIVAT
jgi:hypothetical protein